MTQQISSLVRSKIGLLVCFALLMIGPMESHASVWGDEETIFHIKDVPITGSNNEELCLAFKMTQTNFFVPLWFTRDGYVLGIKGNGGCDRELGRSATSYYSMTDVEIKSYQRDGLLDDPLPEFEMTFWERFMFPVIIVCSILVWLCWLGIKGLFRRKPST